MVAHSVTGTGSGSSGKFTTKELAALANGPSVLVVGRVDTIETELTSPPSISGSVTLDPALPGSHENYVVIVTGLNTGATYVGSMVDNDDDNFNQFLVVSETEGTCMYFISKIGTRPTV